LRLFPPSTATQTSAVSCGLCPCGFETVFVRPLCSLLFRLCLGVPAPVRLFGDRGFPLRSHTPFQSALRAQSDGLVCSPSCCLFRVLFFFVLVPFPPRFLFRAPTHGLFTSRKCGLFFVTERSFSRSDLPFFCNPPVG